MKPEKQERPWVPSLAAIVILAGFVALILFTQGLNTQAFCYVFLAFILCAIALADIERSIVPNRLVLAGLAFWLLSFRFIPLSQFEPGIVSLFFPSVQQGSLVVFFDSLLSALFVSGFILLVSVVAEQLSKKPMLGGGDIKLFFMVGLYLGFWGSVLNLFLSCLLGILVAFLWRRKGKQQQELAEGQPGVQSHTFPFAPAIALATMLTIVFF